MWIALVAAPQKVTAENANVPPPLAPAKASTQQPAQTPSVAPAKQQPPQSTFAVGNNCLARWTGRAFFRAQITDIQGDRYSVYFLDG